MSAPDTVALLGEHRLTHGTDRHWVCTASDCDWRLPFALSYPDREHRAHVAAVLDAHYADRERAAAGKAFVAGWFAHARNPKDRPLVVEDAWHAYRLIASADTYRRTDKEADRA